MKKEYLIYSDESYKKGNYYSNFYGGALINYKSLEKINNVLNSKKDQLNLGAEIKWSKVTDNYLNKYIEMINTFFEFIKKGDIKIRIMFRQNAYVLKKPLDKEKYNKQYYLLYYQFIKHAFGLDYCLDNKHEKVYFKLYLDKLPDTNEKIDEFKEHILFLNNIFDTNIIIRKEDITEINSKDHVIEQCMDIILGSMNFRLNNMHLVKLENTNQRGKTTKSKEKLYKIILKNIREIYPNFNVGISTGIRGNRRNIWLDYYRHWLFISNNSQLDVTKTKKYKKNNSASPT